MLAFAGPKGIQLLLEVERTFARQVGHVGIYSDAVEPMADGTHLCRLLPASVLSIRYSRRDEQKEDADDAVHHRRPQFEGLSGNRRRAPSFRLLSMRDAIDCARQIVR